MSEITIEMRRAVEGYPAIGQTVTVEDSDRVQMLIVQGYAAPAAPAAPAEPVETEPEKPSPTGTSTLNPAGTGATLNTAQAPATPPTS
jgi:hypothetical protein